ncbi:hydrolase [Klebsiella michiganensis]|uniref:hydrolase n=1 Tax=Klebsiella michiganensis TaxID=1134687 RepID=UPI003D96BFE2
MAKPYVRLDKSDAAVLLVDHQTGLLSLVRDIDPDKFKNNVLALGDLAKYFGLPTILTTSFENGPNGPLVPELKSQFPDAPYIARPGNINAWDRMSQAGVQLMSWFGVACELHRDWRNDIEGLGTLFSNHIPDYRNLMTSFNLLQQK